MKGSCSPIPGRRCFGDLPGDGIVVPPPLPIVETLATVGVMRDGVVAAVAGAPRAVAAAGAATRVEVAVAEEATAAPVVPAIVATAVVADLLAAVGVET